jgi:undecaprenyl diphosphate synthase
VIEERSEIMDQNIRFRMIGRREGLPRRVLDEIDKTIDLSRDNTGMVLCLAVNYGGRLELVDAVRQIARQVADGTLQPDDIDEQTIAGSLYTAGMIEPDLLIRTAGEMRLSNFLLWQISYAELWVTEKCWPEFREADLLAALDSFARRDRRFGALQGLVEP